MIAESFAEIFFGNSIALGLPCVSLPRPELLKLAQKVDSDPTLEVTIDLIERVVRAGDLKLPFEIKPGSREALVNGLWDPIGQLLDGKERVRIPGRRAPLLTFLGTFAEASSSASRGGARGAGGLALRRLT